MDSVKVKAYAKINLSLDISGVDNSYHMIDSVVTTIDLYDLISVKKRKKDRLCSVVMYGCGSESIPPDKNNALKAAEAFVNAYDTCGVDVTVWKNIPMGAGLGGSSADVAGVLNAMQKLFAVADDAGVKAIADSLGSDCGYMLKGGYARLTGRGDRVERLKSRLKLDFGLIIPRGGVSTGECYSLFDRLPPPLIRTSGAVLAALAEGDRVALGKSLFNALYAPAGELCGDIKKAYDDLAEFCPLGVNMSGSGSCVYALFENSQFASYAKSRYKGDGKFIITKTRNFPVEEDNG